MSRTYIILYQWGKINRDEFIKFLEKKKAIDTWEYCLPSSIIVKSDKSSTFLSKLIDEKYKDEITHLVIPVGDDFWGRLPDGYWDIFYD